MKSFVSISVISALLLLASATQAADQSAAEKAVLCSGCHGEQGISVSDEIPNLAGQKKAYLIKTIKDFRSNRRVNPTMNAMAAGLSDADVEALAGHFSGLKRP